MRVGQTSVIVFASKLVGSVLGFFATIAFARIVGAEILGIYILILTVLSWLAFAGHLGIGSAVTKRISEDHDSGAYLTAGVIWVILLGFFLSFIIMIAQSKLEAYITGFDEYATISVVWVLIGLLFIRLFYKFPPRIIRGERRVHIAALLSTSRQGVSSLLQIFLVVAGYSLLGMLVGYALGGVIAGVVGLFIIKLKPARPSIRHFKSLFDYGKYSLFGSLKSRIFNDIDILILGVFVPSASVGIYAVAWSLAKFLELFSNAISTTLFPEISHSSAQKSMRAVSGYVEDSLMFTGLIAVPGCVGSYLLADELMSVYGSDFVTGTAVLWMLTLAVLVYVYLKQLLMGLNGIDRPDFAFRVNIIFAISNASLNILLIPQYGIEGAALASISSVSIAVVLAYYYLDTLVEFSIPFREISRQIISALLMGLVVIVLRESSPEIAILQHNSILVLMLVLTGAITYFTILLIISVKFRTTVRHNVPNVIPYLS